MVRGHLKFENPENIPTGQRVTVRVEDTSRAGASSTTLAQTVLEIPEDFDAEIDALPFEIDLDDAVEGCTLRAHLPRHAGDDIREGDLITTESIAADTGTDINVVLRRV